MKNILTRSTKVIYDISLAEYVGIDTANKILEA